MKSEQSERIREQKGLYCDPMLRLSEWDRPRTNGNCGLRFVNLSDHAHLCSKNWVGFMCPVSFLSQPFLMPFSSAAHCFIKIRDKKKKYIKNLTILDYRSLRKQKKNTNTFIRKSTQFSSFYINPCIKKNAILAYKLLNSKSKQEKKGHAKCLQ